MHITRFFAAEKLLRKLLNSLLKQQFFFLGSVVSLDFWCGS